MARFRRDAAGVITAKPFTVKGMGLVEPFPKPRADGGRTRQLLCSKGHDRPTREETIAQAFEAFPPGETYMRVSL